ncbi:MAG TPA: phospholipase C, phosphocholine-specific [Ohtaekwangia sp.]|uniref:phosphocholine-specific phospholipase C n=1 Tax=Ohtaekwangia sp. TaxID=2066019 RepID=UPI002F93ED0A
MDSRREFLKKAAMLSGAAGLSGILPSSIQRAMAINPEVGSTFMDAEHIVVLMQENRSFDHCYGTLQGVRGFNDPRAIQLPNKNKVWLQTNAAGETFAPFRLNIKDTKATWMGSLPHSWTDQVDARNGGKYDQWLLAKKSGHPEYANMPLTLGYYNREDIPFYYSLADAFTVCDQNFCSSLTGTTPNRLYLWTGTIRDEQTSKAQARVRNSELDYDVPAQWKTFPERLEDNGISWKIYQNEISVGVGFNGEEDAWLANFTDNPIEWFTQYNVRFLPAYMKFMPTKINLLTQSIKELEEKIKSLPAGSEELAKTQRDLTQRKGWLQMTIEEQKVWTPENYSKLSQREKNLHEKAFTTNINDPDYHTLTSLTYQEGGETREVKIPKGDILHQFRADVKNGKLPTVSWLVAPENFSDHPGAPWYGAWYVSEAMDILTSNPEVWKKTIFILCYDENDGYYDHVPPFIPPHPAQANSGLVSKGIDTDVEYVMLQQDLQRKPAKEARESPIGLGYRVPLVIASPWSRGGVVNSQVFDHTSILQFLEKFLSNKTGKKITESNISEWRRTVCGDLTSVFKPYHGETIALPSFLEKDEVIEGIHKAKFKNVPSGYKSLSKEDIAALNRKPQSSAFMPQQEKGIRASNALPYELYSHGQLSADKRSFQVQLEARNEVFGNQAAGSPFTIYSNNEKNPRAYAVKAGDHLADAWSLDEFTNGQYHLSVYGPNGFFREFIGDSNDPMLDVFCGYEKKGKALTGNIVLKIANTGSKSYTIEVRDLSYNGKPQSKTIAPKNSISIILDLAGSHSWYDFGITVKDSATFAKRFAGRVETGKTGYTDPVIGQV